jgi:hypothetical protein
LEVEQLERFSLYINLDNNDASLSSRPPCFRHEDPAQGCNSFLPQPKQDPNIEEEDYSAALYRCLGLDHGSDDY